MTSPAPPDQPVNGISAAALKEFCAAFGLQALNLIQANVKLAEQERLLNALKATARVTPLREVAPVVDEGPVAKNGRVRP